MKKRAKKNSNEYKELVFSYGTLQHPKLINKLIGRNVNETPNQLPGYKRFFVPQFLYYGTIKKNGKEGVQGHCFYVTKQELEKLDAWEDEYKRTKVKLKNGKTAWIYMLKNKFIKNQGWRHKRTKADMEALGIGD